MFISSVVGPEVGQEALKKAYIHILHACLFSFSGIARALQLFDVCMCFGLLEFECGEFLGDVIHIFASIFHM